jgi:SAM-dependent methyltransferase
MTEPWMIDEVALAGPEHFDPAFVAAYDAKQGFPDPSADIEALAANGVGPDATVVDIGTGTGQFALAAARRFAHVVAVDVAAPMLDALRAAAAEQRVGNLECVNAGFLSYAAAEASVDAVHSRNALHHLPDFFKALALQRIAEMLRAGGILRLSDLIYDFAPRNTAAVLDGWFAHAATDPSAGYTRDEYVEHVRAEHSTFRWLLEPMLDAAGLEIVSAEFRASLFGSYTCRRR